VFTDAGGLVSYSVNLVEQDRQAASYVDRILRREMPADLPEQPKFEVVINAKTARAISLAIPEALLAIAGEAIQLPRRAARAFNCTTSTVSCVRLRVLVASPFCYQGDVCSGCAP
jgi:hypothetical protein